MQSPLTTDRGKLRMERLRQLELEQLQWEQEALVMPEDLNRALFLSFESVKTEFSDLDGLSWPRYPVPLVTNPWAVEEPTPKLTCTEIDEFPTSPDSRDTRTPVHSPTFPQRRPPLPYSSSSRVDMTPDTIRVSRFAQPSRIPLQPANQFSAQYSPSHKDPLAHSSGSPYTHPHPHPSTNLALACHGLRHPVCGLSSQQ
ncbi:hypothetical protein HD554DRAFT_2123096 [Boletus coccyginus]|nr:hypothetical protein HD554DRAFT_2123096 [Boletus coccyginus]